MKTKKVKKIQCHDVKLEITPDFIESLGRIQTEKWLMDLAILFLIFLALWNITYLNDSQTLSEFICVNMVLLEENSGWQFVFSKIQENKN